MDYHVFKDLINRYLSKHAGRDQRPTFFEIAKTYPALTAVTENFAVIKQEFSAAMSARPHLPRYHDVDPGEHEISNIVDPDKNWNVFMLTLLGHKPSENRKLCPQTCAILDKIPNMIQAFFSILDPGKSIPLHNGPYLGYLRYHLGLQVPKDNPPQIRVNNQPYTWQEGQAVMFDDSWPHEVINTSSEPRAVLIIDVLRPMPWLPTLVNKAVTYGLARPTYGRSVAKRVKKFDFITTG